MQQGEKAQAQGQGQQKQQDPATLSLHAACEQGDSAAVRRLLGNGADPNATGTSGARPLHLAARAGHVSVVKQLLAAGAEVDAADDENYTALHAACEHGHADCVREVVAAGADLDAECNTALRTPALLAAMGGHWALVCELGRRGADLNRVDMCNLRHVVHILARYLRSRRFPLEGPELMRELLAAGASVHSAVYPPAVGEEGEEFSTTGVAPSPIDALLGIDGWGNGPEQDIQELPAGTNVPELIRLLSENGCPVDKRLPSQDDCIYGSTLDLFLPDQYEPGDNGNTWPEGSGAAEVRAALEAAAKREARQSKKRKAPTAGTRF